MSTNKKDYQQAIDGILLLDKPSGITSNDALQKVKHAFNAKKAGHTGALDPLASGMLPITFGQAGKFAQYLLDADKCYECYAVLGVRTTTGDTEGDIVEEKSVPSLDKKALAAVLKKFTGEIEQTPSMYSALKYQGKPLYYYARQGIEVPRKTRRIHIHTLDLLSYQAPRLHLHVRCSKGTYIRSLVEDIGEALGCGAHVSMLQRIYSEPFKDDAVYTMDELLKEEPLALTERLLPVDRALSKYPQLSITAAQARSLGYGQHLKIDPQYPEGLWRVYRDDKTFIGLGEISQRGELKPCKLLAVSQN